MLSGLVDIRMEFFGAKFDYTEHTIFIAGTRT